MTTFNIDAATSTRDDAANMIKALQYALDNNWLHDDQVRER